MYALPLVLAACLPVTAVAAGAHATRFEAVTRLEGEAIAACGVEARGHDDGGIAHVLRVMLEARPLADPLTVLEVEQEVSMSPAPLASAAVVVGGLDSRAAGFAPAQAPAPGRGIRLEAELDADEGAGLLRTLLLSGGRVEVTTAAGGAPTVIGFRGPAPPEVFRRYLQCAGDLYPPAAEPAADAPPP